MLNMSKNEIIYKLRRKIYFKILDKVFERINLISNTNCKSNIKYITKYNIGKGENL